MTRDHKLIWGGGLCGASGCFLGLGAWMVCAAMLIAGLVLIAGAKSE